MTTPDHILPPPLRDDGPLETMARAMCWGDGYADCASACMAANRCRAEPVNDCFIRDAKAVIAALTEAGYVIVPVEPTLEILEHAADYMDEYSARALYRAMIAAFIPPFQVDTKEGE